MLPALRIPLALFLVLTFLALTACDSGPNVEEARVLQAQGRFEASLEPLRTLLDETPDDAEVNFLYGTALNRTTSSPIALFALRKAAEDPAWSAQAHLELAAATMQNADFEAAIGHATRVLEDEPNSIAARSLRGMAYLNEGEAEPALADFDEVLELAPNDEPARASRAAALIMLDRIEEAAEAIARIDEVPEGRSASPATQALVCTTRATLFGERGDVEEAESAFEACLVAHPVDATLIEQAISFFDTLGRRDRATQILEDALEKSPGSAVYRTRLSRRASVDGEDEKAERVLLAGTELPDPRTRGAAWTDLTNLYLTRGDLDRAIDAYREAMGVSPEPTQLAVLTLADLLARAERNAEALEVAKALTRDSYRGLIESRIHLNEGRPAQALARLDTVFPTWPNNPGARYYAGRAAEQLGDFTRAIEEYRQSIRSDPEQTDAGLRLAKLYLAAGSLQNAWNSAAQHFRHHREDAQAVRVLLRAASSAENESVDQLLARLDGGPLWPTAVAMRAQRIEALRGVDAAIAFLDGKEELDLTLPDHAEVLRTRARLLLSNGRGEQALSETSAALASAPGEGAFHEIHGRVMAATGAPTAAIHRALSKAVELAPDASNGLTAIGDHLASEGDLASALTFYQRAAEADPAEPEPARAVARTLSRMGRASDAEAAWEVHLVEHPWDVEAALALTDLRLSNNRLDDRTVELAERAVLFLGGPTAQDRLIEIHHSRGESARAQALEVARRERRPLAPLHVTPIEGAGGGGS